MPKFSSIHRSTIHTYQANAQAWDRQRPKVLFEKAWLDRFIACLPAGGRILDVGCGSGEPIARYLINNQLHLTGIDAAQAMVDICSQRFTMFEWQVMDMRNLSLPKQFDGIVAWDSFFHLNQDEQRTVLELFCRHLSHDGALLLTIGDEAGEVLGTVNAEAVYHASLDPDEYIHILKSAGFNEVVIRLRDQDCAEHSVLLASGFRRALDQS